MSNERHETVADNVSANHHFREVAKMIPHEEVDVSKMETTTPTREKSSAVGNASAMREALEKIANMGEEIDYQLGSSDETVYAFRHERSLAYNISECARTALSAPPRNCDVGTAEEQEKRFNSFCKTHLSGIRSICSAQCPCVGCRSMFHCLTKWSQMTYDEGGAK